MNLVILSGMAYLLLANCGKVSSTPSDLPMMMMILEAGPLAVLFSSTNNPMLFQKNIDMLSSPILTTAIAPVKILVN